MSEEVNNEEVVEVEEKAPDGKVFVKKKRRERLVRKGRLKQERFRMIVRFLLSILFVYILVYLTRVPGWYINSPNYNKDVVEVINNKIVQKDKIYKILNNLQVPNLPIYLIKTNSIKKELLQLAPIENVYIRRFAFPARVLIIVRESVPVITISPDIKVPPVAYFTTDGKLIGKEFMPLDESYKTITVLSYGNKGDDYHKWDIKRVKEIQKIVKYVEDYSNEEVEYVDFRNPNNIFVKINTVNIRLGKLDANVYKRLERLPSILPQVKLVDSKVKYLDLGWDKVNYLKLQ